MGWQVVSLMVGFTLAIDLMVLIMIGLTTGASLTPPCPYCAQASA